MQENNQPKNEPKALTSVLLWIAITLVVPVVLVYGIYNLLQQNSLSSAEVAALNDPIATELRIRPVAEYAFAAQGGAQEVFSVEKTYKAVCAACHAAGVSGAPKFGNSGDWGPRIATGLETLYQVALNGKGAMPARGGLSKAKFSDTQLKMLVVYMANEGGAKFPMPEDDAKPAEGATAEAPAK